MRTTVFLAFASLCLPACLPQAAPTAAGGISEPAPEIAPEAEAKITPPEVTDVASNQPGPEGTMPTGTLAPPGLVPVNFIYRAEGTYCRFEGKETKAMIRGRLFKDSQECADDCQGKHLRMTHPYLGDEVTDTLILDDVPNFDFVVDTDDPKQFVLLVVIQENLAILGQTAPTPPSKGSFVDVSGMQPYTVNGAPAFCPAYVPLKANLSKPFLPLSTPVERRKLAPQP